MAAWETFRLCYNSKPHIYISGTHTHTNALKRAFLFPPLVAFSKINQIGNFSFRTPKIKGNHKKGGVRIRDQTRFPDSCSLPHNVENIPFLKIIFLHQKSSSKTVGFIDVLKAFKISLMIIIKAFKWVFNFLSD